MSDVAAMYADMKRYRDEAVRLQQEVIVWQQEAQSAERKAAARIAALEARLKAALRFIENTENELGVEIDCRFAARAALEKDNAK